jgi:Putative Ig domain/FG-GAP-like repeat
MTIGAVKTGAVAWFGLLVLAFVAVVHADVTWPAAQYLSPPAEDAEDGPQFAIDTQGRATVVWGTADGRIRSVRIGADGTPGPVQTLGTASDVANPHVVVDSQDRAIVVWDRYSSPVTWVDMVRLGADGTPGPIQTVGGPFDTLFPHSNVTIDHQDRATVVWQGRASNSTDTDRIQAVLIGADGTPGVIRTVSEPGRNAALPQLVVDSQGVVTVAWLSVFGQTEHQLRCARIVDGIPGVARSLSASQEILDQRLAVDSHDRVTVAWRWLVFPNAGVSTVRLDADGTPGTIRTLAATGGFNANPQVAIDSGDRALIAWSESGRINSVRVDADGIPGAVQSLSPEGQWTVYAQAAIDVQGRATVVWLNATNNRIQSTRLNADGAPGAVRDLPGAPLSVTRPQLAVDSLSRPSVVWQGSDGASTRVQWTRAALSPDTQTITFNPPATMHIGDQPFKLTAAASSGLPVTYTSQTPGVCTVTGSTVNLVSVGPCTIAASQPGDTSYAAAPSVVRSIAVMPPCGAVAFPIGTLPPALAGLPYSESLAVANVTPPVAFVLSGALPSGLTFSDGVISGTSSGPGAFPITVSATDANACHASASYTLTVSAERRLIAGAGGGGLPTVRAFTLGGTAPLAEWPAFDNAFAGGVSVAQGDTNGDGTADVITGAGPSGGPAIRVFDGVTHATILTFFAFDPGFRGGVEVAAGDLTGDGIPEILATAGCGGPQVVRAFNAQTGALVREYGIAAPSSCGPHVAAGDLNGDGIADIVVGAGTLSAPIVTAIDGFTGATLRQFVPYAPPFTGGVYVAAGDITGDGFADIVTGAGPGGGPHVRAFDGVTGAPIAGPLSSFFAYDAGFSGGVRVAAGDLNGDGRAELITAAGPGGGPHVRVFDGAGGSEILGVFAFGPTFPGGAFVAAPPSAGRMAVTVTTFVRSVRVNGWALKQIGADTEGTDAIHVWALPVGGGPAVFVGAATNRDARPDVASVFGGEFLMCGFDITGTLAPGTYDVAVFARNSRTLLFDQLRLVRITVN